MAVKRKPSRTGAVISSLDKYVFKHKDPAIRARGYSIVEKRLTENVNKQHIDILKDLDLDGIMTEFRRRDPRFNDSVKHLQSNPDLFKPGGSNDRLREHVTDGLELSQFERFLDTCVRLGTFSFCGTQSVDSILALVGGINVDCTTDKLATDPFLIEDDFDDCNPPDSETPLGGLADPIEICVPERRYVKIGYAIKRDLFCGGLAERIRALIEGPDGVSAKLNKRLAKQIVKLLFNLYCPGENPWAFCMDGCSWETYYASADDGSSPWVNMTCVADEFDQCQYGMFCEVETAFDEISHPRTGDPMSCCDAYTIVSGGGRCLAEKFRNLLGIQRVEVGNCVEGETCSETIGFDRASRSGWGDFNWSRLMTRYLIDGLYDLYGPDTATGYTLDQIKQMAERTWLAGCPSQAFQVVTEWEREEVTLQGTNTWQYWNQEILWMKKWSEKWGLMTVNPWAIHKVQGLPDGAVCTDLVC